MTVELIRGQNHPLPETRLEIRVSAGQPIAAGVTLNDERGRMRDATWIAHPASPRLPGVEVSKQAAADHRLAVDLDALPAAVHRVNVLLALPTGVGGPTSFGAVAPPTAAVTGLDGAAIVSYHIVDLDAESAVVALELYRRNDAWKVRAVGQGFAGGLTAMLRDQGLPEAEELAATINAAVASGMARAVAPAPPPPPAQPSQPGRPVAGDATGWSMDERLYNQVWGMFEDLARATAAYRSAVDFADSRMDRELDGVLSDPRNRVGPVADAARAKAQAKRAQLVDQARAALDRDVAQLVAESEVVEPALPPAYARWDNPCWHAYKIPDEVPMALRLGDLSLPEHVGLRIPMLMRMPLQRGLWIDSGRGGGGMEAALHDSEDLRRRAAETATAIAARLLAVHPADGLSVRVIDPTGSVGGLAPLVEAGVLAEPPAVGEAGVTATLAGLTQRVDLVQMAIRSGAGDALPPDIDLAEQLLIVRDFPHGFDDRGVTHLRYLADEGASVGVHLMIIGDREDARAYGPLLDPLWRALLRVTPVPDDHLADPWVGHAWTYDPGLPPQNSQIVPRILRQVAAARQTTQP
ncbi:TerD family protein [Streptomyces radicis]|uniref:Export associated protein n=1 Tax=Streptomyces radicis TaxID=1750517 RepID=A0A3A9VRE0_9ACTN|nr:TerD family protein [Streptomyces radicis]RKN03518.1 export associated protein [Streptomyces radicis]RKN20326.1 export associated protein [Streptomyces radicis]